MPSLSSLRAFRRRALHATLAFILLAFSAAPLLAASKAPAPKSAPPPAAATVYRAPVVVYGTKLFDVGDSSQGDAEKRAGIISKRIEEVVDDETIPPDSIVAEVEGSSASVLAGGRSLFLVTKQDANAVERPLPDAAQAAAKAVATVVVNVRQERTPREKAIHFAIALAGLLLLGTLVLLVSWLFAKAMAAVYARAARLREIDIGAGVQMSLTPVVEVTVSLLRLLRLVAIGLIAYVCVSFVLNQFPMTRGAAYGLIDPFVSAIDAFVTGFVAWLPQLALIVLIAYAGYEGTIFLRVVRDEMNAGRFKIAGFESDWIEPTYRLLSFAVLTVTLMAILPHVPGFNSPSFQAVGLLLSALLTFGSAATISNILGGIVLIYAPSFRVGDYVRIGDAEGEVVEKSLWVTLIRTPKNVVVTMPNASVVGATVFNYSSEVKHGSGPLVVHTTVTLGYDVPWRDVNEALTAAALKTANIVAQPAPFVLQTALNDFNVAYQLNAYTNQPLALPRIYSELHQNMQDECNARSIEILSPGYQALRDGNHTTIPENYLKADYRAPGFRVEQLKDEGGGP